MSKQYLNTIYSQYKSKMSNGPYKGNWQYLYKEYYPIKQKKKILENKKYVLNKFSYKKEKQMRKKNKIHNHCI